MPTEAAFQLHGPAGLHPGVVVVTHDGRQNDLILGSQPMLADLAKHPEFANLSTNYGVYVLFEPQDGGTGTKTIYVGKSKEVLNRIKRHDRDGQIDFDRFAVFAGERLNALHVSYLEPHLIERAKAANRVQVRNVRDEDTEDAPTPWARAVGSGLLDDLLERFLLMGIEVFHQPNVKPEARMLYLRAGGLEARAKQGPDGFLVLAGSRAASAHAPKASGSIIDRRQHLLDQRIVRDDGHAYVFVQNYAFTSASAAASAILGYSENGRLVWTDQNGTALKDLE